MKDCKIRNLWLLVLIVLLLVGCGPIEQRLADGTAVASGRDVGGLFSDGDGQTSADGSGGGDEGISAVQQTANAWEKTLQASLDAQLSLTPAATNTLKPPPLPVAPATQTPTTAAEATSTIDIVKLTGLAQTLTSIAAGSQTPTFTPSPSATQTIETTPSPTEVPCLALRFVAHVTYPPGTIVPASSTFFKSWQVQNVGTCTWTGNFALVYDSGFQLGGASPLLLGSGVVVAPKQYLTLTIQLWTPPQTGTYNSAWLLQDKDGNTFGGGPSHNDPLFVQVVVPGQSPPEFTNPASTSPPFYTSTPAP